VSLHSLVLALALALAPVCVLGGVVPVAPEPDVPETVGSRAGASVSVAVSSSLTEAGVNSGVRVRGVVCWCQLHTTHSRQQAMGFQT
jgi:hypothetical protein